jgi:mono/diheme cytochrome c family protein
MAKGLLLSALLGLVLSAAGCGPARRGEPIIGAAAPDAPGAARGEQVFMAHCHQCHPGGEGGLAPALNDKPLPGFLIKFQVRNGIGAMPAFSESEIPPAELDALIAYLKLLRQRG